ncbi:SDR family oxidoreductase [Hymenobacter cavernae]|uniref:NAD(P)-dependent oxidoreductase n=1 Tax=Hymenobacter cavernae TaxID=2044852 RepID=A0ABQ1TIC4_9BACT|nr:SDR family oxidoreductase [Hymenobacter cavernae]GGE96078.1 NAD(P)-dependent oxidoreductase [Hymenobacter cavernae]
MSHTILVTGATGTVGTEVVLDLVNRGATVRAGVHSIIKGDRLRHIYPDIQLVEIDYNRPDTLHVALTGVNRVFMITPATENQVAIGKQLIEAAKQAGVQQLVKLSVAEADAQPSIQLGRWHQAVEEHLVHSGLNYVLLRPCNFMQNFANRNVDSICHENQIKLPLGEGRVSYIDVRDIAAVAATILTSDLGQHQGKTYTLTGPAALTVQQVADAIGQAVGRPIMYADISEAEARQALSQAPPVMAEVMLELYRADKDNRAAAITNTVEQLTGRPPHTIAQFAHDYRQHFQPAS